MARTWASGRSGAVNTLGQDQTPLLFRVVFDLLTNFGVPIHAAVFCCCEYRAILCLLCVADMAFEFILWFFCFCHGPLMNAQVLG